MNDKDKYTIQVTLKNGNCFEHHHEPKNAKAEMVKLHKKILTGLAEHKKGYLTLWYPLSLYDIRDISSIRFMGIEVGETGKNPIGFHPLKRD